MAKKPVARKQKKQNAVSRFYKETSGELRKVSWPSRKETFSLTKIVVVVMAVMAILLGGLDFLFFEFFDLLLKL